MCLRPGYQRAVSHFEHHFDFIFKDFYSFDERPNCQSHDSELGLAATIGQSEAGLDPQAGEGFREKSASPDD
jgi:hypothetical protein